MLIGHGVRLRSLMHTISSAQNQPILLTMPPPHQRAVRPRLPRNYGFQKLNELVRKRPYLEVKETPDRSGFVHLHVRLKH